jgi:multidrug efflux pump subunit AcrA (membrane-fusion protein)
MRAEAKATTRFVTYSGSVRARREATLGFRVAGKIVERSVNVGERGAGKREVAARRRAERL